MQDKDNLKKEIKDILELVKLCPDQLKEKCFEILLSHFLETQKQLSGPIAPPGKDSGAVTTKPNVPEDILKRVRVFSGQHNIKIEEVEKSFSFDDLGNVNIEVTDLKTAKTTQKQRRLALLIGLRHLFLEGSLEVPTQELREMCVTYATYDAPNFSTNLKNMSAIFAGFKSGSNNKLSPLGKKEAADLIKELAP